MKRICILLKDKAQPDQDLSVWLERELSALGHSVFVDRHAASGLAWARQIEARLGEADLALVLLSEASASSEILAYEAEIADSVSTENDGRPDLMPVRLNLRTPLPESLAGVLHHREFIWDAEAERHRSRLVVWRGPADDQALLQQINSRLAQPPPAPAAARPRRHAARTAAELEPLGGAVPLESAFYIERPSDDEFRTAIRRRDSIVLIKGARQMGKTSLLARGLQQARSVAMRVVLSDLQKLHSSHFATQDEFFHVLAETVAQQLELGDDPGAFWSPRRSPNANLERFWRELVFPRVPGPILWAFDEFDRLFATQYATDVCSLLRSWHNERALDPAGPWRDLTIAIAFATEAHLFISDLNQSPFNVGTRLTLSDLTLEQFAELNRRYSSPVAAAELEPLHAFLGGHPYLCRCALHGIANQKATPARILSEPDLDEGIFSDHLKRLLASLTRDPAILAAVRGFSSGEACPTLDTFYRLRTAGVFAGSSPLDARPRCPLYATFIQRHLR